MKRDNQQCIFKKSLKQRRNSRFYMYEWKKLCKWNQDRIVSAGNTAKPQPAEATDEAVLICPEGEFCTSFVGEDSLKLSECPSFFASRLSLLNTPLTSKTWGVGEESSSKEKINDGCQEAKCAYSLHSGGLWVFKRIHAEELFTS